MVGNIDFDEKHTSKHPCIVTCLVKEKVSKKHEFFKFSTHGNMDFPL
jgi:hypothetical protein